MTQTADDLAEMLVEAQSAGDIVEPKQLLAALSQEANALSTLSDSARAEAFFVAFGDEFGFFPMGQRGEPPLALDRRARWIGLLRWIFSELAGWSVADDPNARKLAAIFIAAQSVRGGRRIWAQMPSSVAENQQLLNALKVVVASAALEFGVRGGMTEPIWEREAVERFKVADQASDWAEIGQSMHLFEHQLFRVGVTLTQSVRILLHCGLDHLVAGTAPVRQTLIAMQLASVLPRSASLALSAASENPYMQFACVYQAVSRHGDNRRLDLLERNDLSATLLKVADDGARWIAWMKVFNTYPLRYPALQNSLGQALVTVPEAALEAYVYAVALHPWQARGEYGHGRRAVADSLRTFRATAPPQRRHILWRLAYERWAAWDFGQRDPNQHLFAINWSDLDYAVVAFVLECLNDAQRAQELDKIRSALQDLDLQWFSSVTDVKTSWNRLLCCFQPFAHAAQASEEDDWLCETRTYLPFDPETDPYIKAKFGL